MSIFNRFGITAVDGAINDYLKNVSPEFQEKLNLWLDMVQGKAPWNTENKPSGIIAAIKGTLIIPCTEEIQIDGENEKLIEAMRNLHAKADENIGNMVTCGGSLVRPVYANGKCQFEIIKQGYYIPTSHDFDGTLTGAVIMKKFQDGKKEFLLCENHEYKNKTHTVRLDIYRIENGGSFFKATLQDCTQTAEMTHTYQYENVKMPFIIELRNPFPNDIDFSNNAIALYGGHENLIRDCDRQYNEINWEQIAGRTIVFADEDLFKSYQNANGKTESVHLTPELEKTVVQLHGNGTSEEKIYTHSPTLRTEQQIKAYNEILRELEKVCRFGFGTLSDTQMQMKTATETKSGKEITYSTVDKYESELEHKYRHIAYVFAYMLSVYEGVKFDPKILITYDEADRKDPATEKLQDMQEVNAGIMNKHEYRMKHYGETEEEAKANTPEIISGGFVM